MKTGAYFFAIGLSFLMVLFACKKEKKEPAPTPTPGPVLPADTALQTAKQVCLVNLLVSDVEMICGVMGEDETNSRANFYEPNLAVSGSGTVTVIRNIAVRRVSYHFNNTICRDGRVRDGSVWMFYKYRLPSMVYPYADSIKPGATPPYDQFDYVYPDLPHPYTGNENYIRDYNFSARITLEEYKVDGWSVDNKDYENPNPTMNNVYAFITNLRSNTVTPLASPLGWSFEGAFTMKKGQDSMAWKGTWTKTLENSNDPQVFASNAQSPVNWALAKVSYTGNSKGYTPGNIAYNYQIDVGYPIGRDFTCSPDLAASPPAAGFHPFTSGVLSFTTAASPNKRTIDYGSVSTAPCDNYAFVTIRSDIYVFDMLK